jgi:Vitamin K-dependent gamma-carboxylase
VLATFCLTIGLFTRTSALIAWALSTSFAGLNSCIDNAGDEIRGIILFYLMISPCGAVWSIDRWRQRRASRGALAPGVESANTLGPKAPIFIHPWPLRLLMVQMILMYFSNGMFKLSGDTWWAGTSLYYVLADLTLARWSYAQFTIPFWLTRILTWFVLVWEAGFPVWVALPWTRKAAFLIGVAFHLGIGLSMELGPFVPYALCLYLPLVPWERLRLKPTRKPFQ